MIPDRSDSRETLRLGLVLLQAKARDLVDKHVPIDDQENMTYAQLDGILRVIDPALSQEINNLIGRSVDS